MSDKGFIAAVKCMLCGSITDVEISDEVAQNGGTIVTHCMCGHAIRINIDPKTKKIT
jgi:hypothetical protein